MFVSVRLPSAYESQNAQMGGNAPLTTSEVSQQIADMTDYQHQQTQIAMATDPWNIYDNNTAVGSFLGTFFANLYAGGNQPLQMAGSLLGMFAGSLGTFAKTLGGSSYAQAATMTGYGAGACDDADIQSLGGGQMAADPFCNVMYGLPSSYDMDITTVDQQMASAINDDGTANPNTPLGQSYTTFLRNCVNRGTPLGMTGDSGETDGSDCLLDSSGNGGNNKLFYNYVQYYRVANAINQGSDLGCQADGSCAGTV